MVVALNRVRMQQTNVTWFWLDGNGCGGLATFSKDTPFIILTGRWCCMHRQ